MGQMTQVSKHWRK